MRILSTSLRDRHPFGLACVVKYLRVVAYTSALWGLVIYAIGCVIPAPLKGEPPPTNYHPVILSETVTPPFGPLLLSPTSEQEIRFDVTDPNPQDTIQALLYRASTGSFTSYGQTTLIKEDPTDQTLNRGTFDPINLCERAGPGAVTLYVSDREIVIENNKIKKDTGLFDEGVWALQCLGQ